jgi:catechol 2,3-dioxygenase-like lactoylglutathione lyase family enzyme
MEAIVSNLVNRFEQGGLTRRQLVAGLAALATTRNVCFASPVTSQSSATAPSTPLQSIVAVDVNHVGINVSDVERSIGWYSDMFGLKVLVRSKDVAVLAFRDSNLNSTSFVFRTSPKPEVNHLMFGIDNFDASALADYLKGKGLTLRDDVLSFHIKDPDGIDVQVGDKGLHPSETVLTHK